LNSKLIAASNGWEKKVDLVPSVAWHAVLVLNNKKFPSDFQPKSISEFKFPGQIGAKCD
jgi:hypothetical protein